MVNVPSSPVTFAGGFAQELRSGRQAAVAERQVGVGEQRNEILREQLEQQAEQAAAEQRRTLRTNELEKVLTTIKEFGTMFRANPESRDQPSVQEMFDTSVEQGVAHAQALGIDPNNILAQAELARQSVNLPPEKMVDKLKNSVLMAGSLMDSGVEPAQVRELFDQMAAANPVMAENFQALADGLPASLEERAALKGRETVAAAEPVASALRGAGVSAPVAAVASLGKTTINLEGKPDPTALGEDEKKDIRTNVRNLDATIRAVDKVTPLINEGTIGIWGAFSRDFGGFVQQLPGIKRVADLLGAKLELDSASVQEALIAGAEFEQAILTFRNLAKSGGKRLTDQDTIRIERATAVLQGNITPDAAQQIMNDLRDSIARLRQEENTLLTTGRIPDQPPATPGGEGKVGVAGQRTSVRIKDDGSFDVLDASGNVIRNFKFQE